MTVAQRSRAADLIASKGQSVTLTRRAAGAYDPATGSATITETTQTVSGAILPLSAFAKQAGNVVTGDQQLLLAGETTAGVALNPEPKVDDTVTDAGGAVWSIIAVEPLSPAGTEIIFDCIVRKGA